tara:strand:+ start:4163 stop:6073 length:1911 start_codon:yes stop_codon:yes gene_type:complete
MADERFQDFPQKTNPSGSDELVGVDGSGYFRTPVSSLPAGGDSLPEFFKFMVGDKILIVQTGQSNPQGLEGRRAAAGVDTWENNRVWDWQWSDRAVVQQDYTNFGDSRWSWVNPATTQTVATNFTFALIYMGYIGGNTGNQAYALANEVQLSTGLDVYVVNLSQGGADVQWWEATSGTPTDMALVLQNALAYILAGSTGVDFGGKPGPDITTWGQSEANFPAPLGTYPDTPTNWADRVDAVFELAKSQTNSWIADGYTKIFLTEATDYVNWDGVPGPGSYAGCPYQWNGANLLGTNYGDDITLVSSRGIEHGNGVDPSMVTVAPASNAGQLTQFIHYSGDGNDAYGRRIADIVLGREREFKDTDLDVENGNMNDRVTALEQGGGSDLNPVQKIFGVNGDNPQVVTHLLSASEGESVTTDGQVYGNEPIRCHMTAGGSVTENYALFAPGAAYITSSGANGYTGVELSVYPLIGTTTPKFKFGANVAWLSDNNTSSRYLLRVGWHRPMNQSNRDYGMYFEFRYDSPNWWAVVEDSVGRTEQDTGIVAAQWVNLLSNVDSLLVEYDLSTQTATFSIDGALGASSTVVLSTTGFADLDKLASAGIYIERTEGTDPAQAQVDFMYVDATTLNDNYNLSLFV